MLLLFFILKKHRIYLVVCSIYTTFAANFKNIRGAEAFAEAEKIPIEPDAGNAVGGKKYESKYQQQTTRDARCQFARACHPIAVATERCGNSHR